LNTRRPEGELTREQNVQLPAVRVYSRCGARGAVIRDNNSKDVRAALVDKIKWLQPRPIYRCRETAQR